MTMNEAFSPALRPEAPQETGRVSRKTLEPAVSVVSATDVRLTEGPARPGGVCVTSSHLFRAGVAAHSAVSVEGTPLVQTRCRCGGTEAARWGGWGVKGAPVRGPLFPWLQAQSSLGVALGQDCVLSRGGLSGRRGAWSLRVGGPDPLPQLQSSPWGC